jgi:antitoxin component of RelBE/YafQ-DinJ toxin-antitoxin module
MPDAPRAIRIPDDLWQAALAAAERRGETVSDVVRRALQRYVKSIDRPPQR